MTFWRKKKTVSLPLPTQSLSLEKLPRVSPTCISGRCDPRWSIWKVLMGAPSAERALTVQVREADGEGALSL